MKKALLIFIFFVVFFRVPVFAQEVTLPMPTGSLSPNLTPTTVNYELPYPGILPGTPLYALKSLRDKLNDLFITNPLRKSNFYLLQADKRLAASIMLFKNGNEKLGEETLSKSLNYLDMSFEKMQEAKKSQENVLDIYGKLISSSSKQKEQIEKLEKGVKGDTLQKLQTDYQRAEELQEKVNVFKP